MRATAIAALVLPLAVGTVDATDVIRNGAWADGLNCIDHAWNTDYAYIYQCHGEPNQQWTLTEDGQIRSAQGNCMEFYDDSDRVGIVPCASYSRQNWFVTDGLIKPQGFRWSDGTWHMRVGWCIDATQPDGKLILHGCHGSPNQRFSTSFFPKEREDIVLITGPWPVGENCLDYDFSSDVAYIYSCHGQWNQRWRFSKADELRVGADKCLEFDEKNKLTFVRTCTGASNQKWLVRDDKLLQAITTTSNVCLQAPYPTSKLSLAVCDSTKTTQQFGSSVLKSKLRDVLKVAGPWKDSQNCVDYAWGTENVYIYSCHGEANQLWEFTSDQQIRTADNKCLGFNGDAPTKVLAVPCNVESMTQKWQVQKATGAIVPRGYFTAGGGWRQLNKCIDASLSDNTLMLWDCHGGQNQRFLSEVFPTVVRDYVMAPNAVSAAGNNCLRTSNGAIVIAQCGATREMLWDMTKDGFIRVQLDDTATGTRCLTANPVADTVTTAPCTGAANQRWERTVSGSIALQPSAVAYDKCLSWYRVPTVSLRACGTSSQPFTSSIFDGMTSASSPQLTSLFESANALSAAVRKDAFLTTNVLSRAAVVVEKASVVLTSSVVSDAQRASDFLVQFLTKSDNTTHPRVNAAALYSTSESEEFLLTLATLLQSDTAKAAAVLQAMEPALQAFSNQLLQARYDELLNYVLRNDVDRLGAYSDGSLSDFDQVGGMLRAVCALSTTAQTRQLAMCRLAAYFSLIDEFFVLKYKLAIDGPRRVSNETQAQATKIATIFKENQATFAQDKLWTRLMTLLLLDSAYIDVLPPSKLAQASESDVYLPTFVLYAALGTNPTFLEQVDPMVRFLSDQITTFHTNNLLTMITNQDSAALEAYMAEPFGGFRAAKTATMSDFPTMVKYVAPLVCSDVARIAPLSLCRLQEFYDGVQSVLRFERTSRSADISLVNLLEVDVRKKLDVLDAEKKQFELLTTVQQAANQIGASLNTGFQDLGKQINASTAAIRDDIEKSRQDIRAAIGDVGVKLQTSIETNAERLYQEVGQQAATIRGDIAESTRQLSDRLDDTGRAILGQIEQSKQELKSQIGAEAEATRELINTKSQELKTHMTQETQGLRQFIDVKTNEVIGVVRDESKLTRQTVNDAAGQIIKSVEKEGAITRAHVDTKTNEIKEVVKAESAKVIEFVDKKTNQVIKVVQEEARTTRSKIDDVGNKIIEVVKDEGDKTRQEVRDEGKKIREHMDEKTEEIKGVVRDEGAMTRDEVKKQSAELKQHMSDEAGGIKGAITESQNKILDKSEQQFKNLTGQIGGVRSDLAANTKKILGTIREATGKLGAVAMADCVTFETASVDFKKARTTYKNALKELGNGFDEETYIPMLDAEEYGEGEPLIISLIYMIVGTFWGQFDGMATSPSDNMSYWDVMFQRYAPEEVTYAAKALLAIRRELALARSTDPDKWDYYFFITTDDDATLEDFATDYAAYHFDVPEALLLSAMDNIREVLTFECNWRERQCELPNSSCYPDYSRCTRHYPLIDKIKARLQAAFTSRTQMREALGRAAAAGIRCDKGEDAVLWSKRSSRRLQATATTNLEEPYYAMTYTALTKILLDYQLQEAAFQFCKYYEFKNGGVAPPMCGSASTTKVHFTMAQIQQMRSWQPTAQRRLTKRLLFPTQSAVQASTNRSYPFVNIATLQAGGTVLFTPATWDLDWLKRHGWVLSNAKEETFPSYYVESMRLYLPVQTNDTTGAAATAAFTITATMEAMPDQFPSWKLRGRTYHLPIQGFAFDATYGEPLCAAASKQTNPYHETAECVIASGRKSEICAVSDGSIGAGDVQKMLLPSLFATWRITADFDRDDALYKLAAPFTPNSSNVTTPPFNLIADAVLVQATATASSLRSTEADTSRSVNAVASTCCANSEFRNAQGACVACPTGAKSALNGYTCSA